jgi:hypothetical protein
MKKLLILGTAAMFVSTSVFATQTRLLALGMKETDNEGMYYISDARNIFLNPAYVNLYSDQLVTEWGSFGFNGSVLGTDSNATVYRTTSPKAQGGAFKKIGNMTYGAYFGNESNTSSLLRIAGSSAIGSVNGITNGTTFAGTNSTMLQTTDNQLDVFVGGDSGVKWGANALYAQGKDESRSAKNSAAAIRGGVIGSNWDAHLNLSVNNKSTASDTITAPALGVASTVVNQEFKGKFGAQLGGSYAYSGNNRIYGYVKHYGWEQTDSFNGYSAAISAKIGGQNGTVKGDFTSYYLGWGSQYDVNTTGKLFAAVSAKKTDINLKFTNKGEVRHLVVPVTLGYEAVATDWLTLRGSIIQNLWGTRDNKNMSSLNPVAKNLITTLYGDSGKATLRNSTEVNAGATLTYGQLSLDGLIGLTSSSRTGTNAERNSGSLAFDNVSSTVALTYKY